MNIKIDWTQDAKSKRDALIVVEPKLRNYFAATYESLKNGEIGIPKNGNYEVYVEFTNYKLVLEIETDYPTRIKFVGIIDVK